MYVSSFLLMFYFVLRNKGSKVNTTNMKAGEDSSNEQVPFPAENAECARIRQKMQSMFPSVHVLSSGELRRMLLQQHKDSTQSASPRLVLVDVRTQAEQDVSVLQGAVPLSQVDDVLSAADDNTRVITYCTVGFRACLEAQRLQTKYPRLQVSCLDGIACYTHHDIVKPQADYDITSSTSSVHLPVPHIVHPHTGQPAYRVHTFGEQWKTCVHKEYEKVSFTSNTLVNYHSLQFGIGMAYRLLRDKVEDVFFSV